MRKTNRVVIWGHRPNKLNQRLGKFLPPHTHSYIHQNYFKAFKFLGLETYWINEASSLDESLLKNAIVFTEDQVDENLVVNQSSIYITHHSTKSKYLEDGVRRINLCNFVMDLLDGESYNYPGGTVERIDDVTFFDSANMALYQPWATDLLPSEFSSTVRNPLQFESKALNYVGTTNHDGLASRFAKLKKAAKSHNLNFKAYRGVSDEKAIRLVQESAFAFDLRGDWHLERGYIPCRIWKAMSYGRLISSNSMKLKAVMGDRVNFQVNEELLVETALERESDRHSLELAIQNQDWVKMNHTYLNRASALLNLANQVW